MHIDNEVVVYTQKKKLKTLFYIAILVPLSFLVSVFLLNFYTAGDQAHYHKFYEALKTARLSEIMTLGLLYIDSAEPLSTVVFWLGAKLGFDKNVFISALNVVLVVGLFLLARKHNASKLTIALLLTNFYLIVLMTGAERGQVQKLL